MAYEVVMPRLGWSMEEGILVEWLKKSGDPVRTGDVICVIESDKAQNEVESFEGGILHIPADSPPPGTKVPVGTLLGFILAPGETAPVSPPPPSAGRPGAGTWTPSRELLPIATPSLAARPASVASGPRGLAVSAPAPSAPEPAISPRARRVAAELGVAWATIKGSGRTGRIVERDVRAAVGRSAPAGQPGRASPMRRLIAERMHASARTTAPVTLTTEADATELVRLRAGSESDTNAGGGLAPSYNDLLTKLVAIALTEHPALNASLVGDEIVRHPAVHVGLAVDTERGLVVCVQRDVHARSLREIAAASPALVAAARAGTLSPDALRGGTFTITNLGPYEIDAFTPIINLPEGAILGVGRIVARPVVVDEASERIGVRRMMALSLTFDHRVVDGAPAARFLQRVKQLVERPDLWLTR